MDAGCHRGATVARHWIAIVLTAALAGCSLSRSNTVWREPYSPPPIRAATGPLASAQANFERGQQAESDGDPVAVDYYYAAAIESWPLHAAASGATGDVGSELYRAAVRKLVVSAANNGRFDSSQGVTLADGQRIPVRYYGFLWQPEDFRCVLPVGTYAVRQLPLRYASTGVGIEFVILTNDTPQRPFIASRQPFAATAVLKPVGPPGMGGFALEFYDPLRTATTSDGLPLARDLTAPIAYAATQEGDAWLEGFIRPSDTNAQASLNMNEPFQPGKIPLVLVHGLASSPVTWSHLENDLRAQPAIVARYQIWVFRYDTGDPFLASAAALRRQLAGLRQTYDPNHVDPSLSQMVLVGHSLGGLVSKLQVTNSGDELWSSAAKVPIDSIRTDADTRARLANSFFFAPSPDVTRVIYIATPHRGSVYAQRCVGLVGSALVVEPPDWPARHAQLVRDNPCAFHDELSRGIPTSINLLEPTSCILQATGRLPYRPGVALHSIIGDDRWTLSEGRSDGVVAVSSARLVGVQSELTVDASHTEIQHRSETSREVLRILLAHAAAAPACQ
jgi:pimeloyl-ACP methyl ester carboxylesterase